MDLTTGIELNNGVEIPRLGFGVYQIPAGKETQKAVEWALELGYRHIDTASIYNNEADVGKGLLTSGLSRKSVFLTTKIWNEDMRNKNLIDSFERSLERLKTDYIDLYLIHWPVDGSYLYTWEWMQKLYEDGKVRSIGVSNFHIQHLKQLEKLGGMVPAVDQIELHPWLTQKPLRKYLNEKGIVCESYSPLGGKGSKLLENDTLNEIAHKYNKTPAQIVLRWDLQNGIVVFPKSTHKERIKQNRDIFDFELTFEDMERIEQLNINKRSGANPDKFNF